VIAPVFATRVLTSGSPAHVVDGGASTTSGWIVAQWPQSAGKMPSSDSLVRQFHVHGIHGNVVFVVGQSGHVVPELQRIGFEVLPGMTRVFSPADRLYAVEFTPRFRDVITAAFKNRNAFAQVRKTGI